MMIESYMPIRWENNFLKLLDQRLLPHEEIFVEVKSLQDCAAAIKDMVVRGAPCIGFTAIYGMALWVRNQTSLNLETCRKACDELISARPTAVNLAFEVNRCFELMRSSLDNKESLEGIYHRLLEFGHQQIKESHDKNLMMAKTAVADLEQRLDKKIWNLMTHCNTGFLACGSLGTALGVISHAHSLGKVGHVFADETRPYLQGSRLTAFELKKENIPHSIVVEGAASYLLSQGKVDAIFVGADRIAANGDTANKVGTSTLAIVASFYKVPFFVVAPISSFDVSTKSGKDIEIEMRPMEEITEYKGHKIAPHGSLAINPSFDVTSCQHITGIICEKGFIDPKIPNEVLRVVSK
jgi:methylthioribose-1-phosphate isomerase